MQPGECAAPDKRWRGPAGNVRHRVEKSRMLASAHACAEAGLPCAPRQICRLAALKRRRAGRKNLPALRSIWSSRRTRTRHLMLTKHSNDQANSITYANFALPKYRIRRCSQPYLTGTVTSIENAPIYVKQGQLDISARAPLPSCKKFHSHCGLLKTNHDQPNQREDDQDRKNKAHQGHGKVRSRPPFRIELDEVK